MMPKNYRFNVLSIVSFMFAVVITISACQNNSFLPTPEFSQNAIAAITSESTEPLLPVVISEFTPIPSPTIQNTLTLSKTLASNNITAQYTDINPNIPPTPIPSDYWKSLPVIPTISLTAREIYQRGLDMGRDPHAFSKVGDCQSISTYFLSNFEYSGKYTLGDYAYLQETLDWFQGSFSRESLAVQGGFNAAAILSPLRADPVQCHPDENPIACEFRLHNPSIAIISLEEWWSGHPENYEKYMRQIIEYTIDQGILPIIATKADNLEGNHLINQTIARLALEYDIPLWNFWAAVQPIPNHGLMAKDSKGNSDMFHLTHRANYYNYDNPYTLRSGWSVRNLTALQALDAVRLGLDNQP